MHNNQAICPICGKADTVEKVPVLYVNALGIRSRSSPPAPDIAGLQTLSRKLAPPASQKQVFMRPVHPDMAVLAFSLIAPFFLYGIWSTQRNTLPVVIALLAAFYLTYFMLRKNLAARFRAEQARQKVEAERIRHGIERWMKLYYCARDDGVFEPGASELVPVDMMRSHLLREA